MTASTVVLLRHGRTPWNVASRIQGQTDVPLDEVGRWQAAETAAALVRRVRADVVVTSDLSRAADTARAYAGLLGLEVVTDERLRERGFGQWEGLLGKEVEERWPDKYAIWRHGGEAPGVPPEGESRRATAERVAGAVNEHAERLENGKTLVVVSHGAAINLALTLMLGLDPAAWRGMVGLDNAHWAELRRARGDLAPAWRISAHNLSAGYAPDEWMTGPGPEASLDEPGPDDVVPRDLEAGARSA
jgi:probable phosphoglycerate mutase